MLGLGFAGALAPAVRGAAVFAPGDPIVGGQDNLAGSFLAGTGNGGAPNNSWPNGESPNHAIDNVGQKYLNFGRLNTGILVQPAFNGGTGSVVNSMQLWTANDAPERDPTSYTLLGSNTAQNMFGTTFNLADFTTISTGNFTLPGNRQGGGASPLLAQNSLTLNFNNTTSYQYYLILFPTVAGAGNSMQIGEIQLFGTAPTALITWNGAASNIWDVGISQNWTGKPTFGDGDSPTFDDTGANRNIVVQNPGGVTTANMTLANETQPYTFSGAAITSMETLIKNGAATATLNNAVSFASGIVVNGGTLTIGNTGSIGNSPLQINNPSGAIPAPDTVVNLSTAQTVSSLSGTVLLAGLNNAILNLNGGLTVNQTTTTTYGGSIQGTGGLTKGGNGTLVLAGVNTYAGPTVVNGGTLHSNAPGSQAQGALPANQPVTVNAGATLLLGDQGLGYQAGRVSSVTVNNGRVVSGALSHSTLPPVTLNGGTLAAVDGGVFVETSAVNYILDGDVATVGSASRSVINAPTIRLRKDPNNTGTSGQVNFSIPRGTADIDLSITSKVQDKGAGLSKSGTGILRLSNANEYTGQTTISAGTLIARTPKSLGTGEVVMSGGTLSLSAYGKFNGFQDFTLNGGATLDGAQNMLTLTTNGGDQSRTAFSNSAVSIANGFTVSFSYQCSGPANADGTAFVIQSNSPTVVGAGGGGLAYQGINNSVAYQLNLYVGGGQPVGSAVAFGGAVGPYTAFTLPFNLKVADPTIVTLTYNPTTQEFTENLTNSSGSYNRVQTGIDLTSFLGGDTGFVGFTGATGGQFANQTVQNFSFDNNTSSFVLSNNIAVTAGASATLDVAPTQFGIANATLTGTFSIGAGSTVNFAAGDPIDEFGYTLNVTGVTNIGTNSTLNVANNGTGEGVVTLDDVGQTTPGASLVKAGDGTLIVGGDAAYSGTTTVNAGTLIVNGTLSGALTTINGGATLGGTGTLTGVTVTSGGIVSPGNNGIGTIDTGPLSLLGGATFAAQIGATTGDEVEVAGAATLSGTITLALGLIADPVDFTAFPLLDGTAPLIGYAAGARFSYQGNSLDEGEVFTTTGAFSQQFQITYTGDGGRDVILTAIPEPATGMALLVGGSMLLGMRRRKERGE